MIHYCCEFLHGNQLKLYNATLKLLLVTILEATLKRREYNDGCATAHALDIIGERWSLLIMRELLLGPKRFSDLRAGLPGISANLLTQRLQGLEELSIVRRRRMPPPAASQVYELTEWGMESEELIKVMGRWAARSPNLSEGKPMSVNSVVLSFRTMFNSEKAGDFDASIGLRFGEDEFLARLSHGELDISRGRADEGDAVVSCDQNALVAVVYGGVPVDDMVKSGALELKGKATIFKRFCRLFPLPESAPKLRD